MTVLAPDLKTAVDVLAGIIARRLQLQQPVYIDIVRAQGLPQAAVNVWTGVVTLTEDVRVLPKRQVAVLLAHEIAHCVLAVDPDRARPSMPVPARLHRLHIEMIADAAAARLFGAPTVVATLEGLHPRFDDRRSSATHPSLDTRCRALAAGRYAGRWAHIEPPVGIVKRPIRPTM
jgi:hypothetical protein